MAPSELADVLRDAGYRVTRPRTAVWAVLVEADEHLTVDEVSARVEQRLPGVNLASVYRSLSLLRDLDLVRESRLAGSDASTWEVAHPDDHFHLVCTNCGTVTHHVGDLVDKVRTHLEDGHGFDADTIELVVHGRCQACSRPG